MIEYIKDKLGLNRSSNRIISDNVKYIRNSGNLKTMILGGLKNESFNEKNVKLVCRSAGRKNFIKTLDEIEQDYKVQLAKIKTIRKIINVKS